MGALVLSEADLAVLFPAFLKLDPAGVIVDAGPSLLRHMGRELLHCNFFDRVTLELPTKVCDIEALRRHRRAVIVQCKGHNDLRLRGLVLDRCDGIWLLLGHIPNPEIEEALQPLRIADFSPTDGTLDMMLAADMRSGLLAETRALATELEAQRKEAEAANRAKSAFLATMSHEIRTPMNAVLGVAGILAETDITPEQRAWLDIMVGSGQSLMELLNNILDLSKIESGSMEINSEEFDLRELCASVHALHAPAAAEKGVECVMQIDLEGTFYKGDPMRIRQILSNLVGNAAKFTDTGQIIIRMREWLHDGARHLEMSVSDTGIGIAAESIPRLFKVFMQADSSTTRRYGGTGLGLSISKRLTEQMGGVITVDSRLGRGSVFTVTLPVELASPPASSIPAPEPGISRPRHILIVDDNGTNRMILSHFLRRLGHSFDLATNGQEALAKWEGSQYDLIIMDIEMPIMDGLETTREIRRRENSEVRRYTPIIALSADAMVQKRETAISVGMDDYLTKPVVLAEIENRIQTICTLPHCAGSA